MSISKRAGRRLGELHAHRVEHGPDDAVALVEIPAAQELLGGAPLQLEPERRRRAGRGGEIHLGGVVPAAARRQRVAALDLDLAPRRRIERREIERGLVEGGGAIEGQRLARAIGSVERVRRRAFRLPGAAKVLDQRLRLDVALALRARARAGRESRADRPASGAR